jgi:hypothetical protein
MTATRHSIANALRLTRATRGAFGRVRVRYGHVDGVDELLQVVFNALARVECVALEARTVVVERRTKRRAA